VGHLDFVTVAAFDRFQQLAAGDYDLLHWGTTHTMERQVVEPTTGQSFAFSVPYLYTGLQFAGIPDYVACTDNFTISETACSTDLKICALDGTTHIDIITNKFPNVPIVSVVGSNALYSNFLSGLCNVMASEQFDIVESILRDRGYSGDYEMGAQLHSKEPLCMVTTTEDPEWSDFVNWVLQALLSAEDAGIVQETAALIGETTVFGDEGSPLALAFRNAVQAVGSYSELYQRSLGTLLPRPTINTINTGDTGLLYSFPFGDVDIVGPTPPSWSTLSRIQARGFLKCGISTRVIFANLNETTQTWDGTLPCHEMEHIIGDLFV
jgi:ABC-type amino acid transport substrate-binding protein